MRSAEAIGLGLGYLADLALGDPRRGHPVAGFGRLAGAVEDRFYADRRTAGVVTVLILVGGAAALGVVADRLTRDRPVARAVAVATGTWAVLGGRSLRREAMIISAQVAAADLPAARKRIQHLVGRDPSELDAAELSRACVESVAENTSDAVVAPLFWGAVLGLPGLLTYRAANTLDAMFGHRSARYERFGWAAARFDDVANWLPARLSAGLVAAFAPSVDGSAEEALRVVARDSAAHPSPNAGVVEAAFAGALGVRLGGANVYRGQIEHRGDLGDGRAVGPRDIERAVRLCAYVTGAAAALAVAGRAWVRP